MQATVDSATPHQQEPRERSARIVWALAWPAVALNSLQVVNNVLDRGFIGRLEPSAMAAQSAAMNVSFLMFSLSVAVATAATAIVSRSYGAEDHETLHLANKQCTNLALIIGVVLALATVVVAPLASRALLPSQDLRAIELMSKFLVIYSLSLPATNLIQVLAGSLRGIGDTKSPMVISGIQIVLHIILNYLLIFPTHVFAGLQIPGWNLGLMGAAWSMVISGWVAAIIYVGFSAKTPLGPSWELVRPTLEWAGRIFKIAIPAAVMSILRVFSMAAFTLVLKATNSPMDSAQILAAKTSGWFGLATIPGFPIALWTPASEALITPASAAIAAMAIGFAIESVMFMPSFGLSIAAAALVGQSLGMGKPDRAERLGWTATHHAGAVTFAFLIPLFIFANPLAEALIPSNQLMADEASNLIRWLCATEIPFAYAVVLIGSMQGAGDTVRPLWITIGTLWVTRVPLAYILAVVLGLGSTGAWIAMSFSQLLQGILTVLLFRQGAWKTKKV